MKTIKTYTCECGEEFYEDDIECINCGKPVNPNKFVEEPVGEITYSGPVTEVELPLIKEKTKMEFTKMELEIIRLVLMNVSIKYANIEYRDKTYFEKICELEERFNIACKDLNDLS